MSLSDEDWAKKGPFPGSRKAKPFAGKVKPVPLVGNGSLRVGKPDPERMLKEMVAKPWHIEFVHGILAGNSIERAFNDALPPDRERPKNYSYAWKLRERYRPVLEAYWEEAAENCGITKEKYVNGTIRLSEGAQAAGNWGAAVTAWKALGDALGHNAPTEHRHAHIHAHTTLEEAWRERARLAQQIEELGIKPEVMDDGG